MPLAPATRLGPYEILAPLGAGGMGEVYRARDTRLGREVALKILPPEVAGDPSRRQRFELEARAVAALNHPNIVAVFDVGHGDGQPSYMVTELVDGEPLRSAKFSLRKTLDIAVQIANGLAAAHDAGIVHRDLKPDNILLTRDGRVKILDFGLAKVSATRTAAAGATETLTVRTDPGTVMGTVGYMSPEQVRGSPIDNRADIFSFGVILHELLGGKRPFNGETSVDTMQAILRQDPPDLPETVPAPVRQIVAHCLEKDPVNRFQSARDLGFALTQSGSQTGGTPALKSPSRSPRRILAALAVLAFGALCGLAVFLWIGIAPQPVWSGVALGGPEIAYGTRVSPDGHMLAFQAMVDGQTQVAVMKPETGNWSVLTHHRDHGTIDVITWSPDGASIYYDRFADVPLGIYSVPVLGGEEHLVLENAELPEALPDGSLLVCRVNAQRQMQLFRFWPETGRLQGFPIQVHFSFGRSTAVFPDGREAIVAGSPLLGKGDWHLVAVDLASGKMRRLTPQTENDSGLTAFAATRDGKFVVAIDNSDALRRIVSIPRNGRSEAKTLFTMTNNAISVDAGPDGSVYLELYDRSAELVRLSPLGAPLEKIASLPLISAPETMAVLPDGRAAVPIRASGRDRLMAIEKGKDPSPLVATQEETSAPVTVAGTREIAFVIGTAPQQNIAVADIASGRITRRIAPGKGVIQSLAASPDGKTLYCAAGDSIWELASSSGVPKMIRPGEAVTADPSGRYLVVQQIERSKLRWFRVPLSGGPEQEVMPDPSVPVYSVPVGANAVSPDGRVLVPLQPLDSWFNPPGILDLATGRITRLPADNVSDYHGLGWTPNGQILALKVGTRSTMWRFHKM